MDQQTLQRISDQLNKFGNALGIVASTVATLSGGVNGGAVANLQIEWFATIKCLQTIFTKSHG